MNHAKRGADALASSDGPTALSSYTKALLEHPTSPDYFVQRSTAFTRLKPPRYDLSLNDADFAVQLAQKRASRDKIQAAQQRRVVALFGLKKYYDAAFILQSMEKWRPKTPKDAQPMNTEFAGARKDAMQGQMWQAKIDMRIKALSDAEKEEQSRVTVKEYPEGVPPDEKQMKAWLQGQLKSDGTFCFEGDEDVKPKVETKDKQPEAAIAKQSNPTHALSTNESASTGPPVLAKIRHEWYQNAQTVTVTIYAKGVARDKAMIDIEEDSVSISFPHPSNPASTFEFTLDPLFALVDADASSSVVMSTKVELTLHKQAAGQKWPALEGSAPLKSSISDTDSNAKAAVMSTLAAQAPATSIASDKAPSYPTSSRHGTKNWDKLATDLTTKPKKKKANKENKNAESASESEGEDDGYDSEYGGDATDGFFKKLFKNADPETQRAMQKSYIESNGTALSTNWAEVGSKRVEPVKSKDEED